MNTRRAFTLVEVLTVIVIISILAALVTVAVAGAMRAGKRAAIATEISQIAMALEQYKNELGEYPPDLFDVEALVRHVKKRWPRLNWSNMPNPSLAPTPLPNDYPSDWATMTSSEQNAWMQAWKEAWSIKRAISVTYSDFSPNVDFTQRNAPLGALALWLGGFPNADGKLSGFFADPENPFIIPANTITYDQKVFIDLEFNGDNSKRIRIYKYRVSDALLPVMGSEIQSAFVPVVYFRGKSSGGHDAYLTGFGDVKRLDFADAGVCVPYMDAENGITMKWKNPTTYQLIHPGLDTKFGDSNNGKRVINSGFGIVLWDLDNITNFSNYKELKSILP